MREFIRKYPATFVDVMSSIIFTNEKHREKSADEGIETTCALIEEQSRNNGKIIFIGNGGSAAISSHMSIDFWKNGKIPSISFNDGALLTCIGNDYGYEKIFEKPIEMFTKQADVLVAISSSGNSVNILNGVSAAQKKGCSIVTLSGFQQDNPLRKMGLCNFYVPIEKYGLVEVAHQYVCHWILDSIVHENNKMSI